MEWVLLGMITTLIVVGLYFARVNARLHRRTKTKDIERRKKNARTK